MIGGYYLSRCVQVAAELGIADLIEDTRMSAGALVARIGSHPEALIEAPVVSRAVAVCNLCARQKTQKGDPKVAFLLHR